jgi:hypothetical protein
MSVLIPTKNVNYNINQKGKFPRWKYPNCSKVSKHKMMLQEQEQEQL